MTMWQRSLSFRGRRPELGRPRCRPTVALRFRLKPWRSFTVRTLSMKDFLWQGWGCVDEKGALDGGKDVGLDETYLVIRQRSTRFERVQ